MLPIAPFTETSGTYVNIEGAWQGFTASAKQYHDTRPGWKVLNRLGYLCEVSAFDYESSQQISNEVLQRVQHSAVYETMRSLPTQLALSSSSEQCTRISEWPLYRGDAIVRHAAPLQATGLGRKVGAYLHPDLAIKYQVSEGDSILVRQSEGAWVRLVVYLDEGLPVNSVMIPSGFSEVAELGSICGPIEIAKG